MRVLRLARAAAEAERLLLTVRLRRAVIQGVFIGIGAVFLVAALAAGHVAVWIAIAPLVTPLHAALIILGGDFVLGLILCVIGASLGATPAEREARSIRDAALAGMREPGAVFGALGPAARFLMTTMLPAILSRRRRRRAPPEP